VPIESTVSRIGAFSANMSEQTCRGTQNHLAVAEALHCGVMFVPSLRSGVGFSLRHSIQIN
jgi:hypothetical protein